MQVPMSPVRILKRAVKLYPNKTAVVDGSLRLSYAEVQTRVNQFIPEQRPLFFMPISSRYWRKYCRNLKL